VTGSPKRGNQGPAPAPLRGADAAANQPQFPPRPLKPRPILFAFLCLVFTLWAGFLLALYFKTEYPRRSVAPRPDAKGNLVPEVSPPARR